MFPARVCTATVVPAGRLAAQSTAPHVVGPPPSKTREVKLPAAAYGVTRSHSTLTLFAPATNPEFVFVESARVYWTNSGSNGSIRWCPTSGCIPADAGADAAVDAAAFVRYLATGQNDPAWIASDPAAIYWTNNGSNELKKIRKPQ